MNSPSLRIPCTTVIRWSSGKTACSHFSSIHSWQCAPPVTRTPLRRDKKVQTGALRYRWFLMRQLKGLRWLSSVMSILSLEVRDEFCLQCLISIGHVDLDVSECQRLNQMPCGQGNARAWRWGHFNPITPSLMMMKSVVCVRMSITAQEIMWAKFFGSASTLSERVMSQMHLMAAGTIEMYVLAAKA